jgi:hypothetical protein
MSDVSEATLDSVLDAVKALKAVGFDIFPCNTYIDADLPVQRLAQRRDLHEQHQQPPKENPHAEDSSPRRFV